MHAGARFAVAAVAVIACQSACRRPQPSLPDKVVLIVIDTLRKDHLPFYGYPRDTAPFMGRLAKRGYVFDNAVASSSWTAPATASLFTSLYPFQHGVITGINATLRVQEAGYRLELNRIPEEAATLGVTLRQAGYETFGVAANMNISEALGFTQGFDSFVTLKESDAKHVMAEVKQLRPRLLGAGKYFLYLHFMDPHQPYSGRGDSFDQRLTGLARRISAYDSEIRYCDLHIRRLFHMFGWERNALVLLTSDHGEAFEEHGASGHGNNLFGEVLNVPLLVHPPGGLGEGRRIAEPVSHLEVRPTRRERAGLPPLELAEGVSLVPLLRGDRLPQPPRTLYAHLFRTPGYQGRDRSTVHEAALREGWKWVGGTDDHGLFDLARDPGELQDRAADRAQIARALEGSYGDFKDRARRLKGVTGTVQLDAEMLERLKALGYVN